MQMLTPSYLFSVSGRVSRSEYWLYFQLPLIVFSVLANLALSHGLPGLALVMDIGLLAALVPSILGGIRRFHDRNKSGWWMLICLVPLIGSLWILIELGFLRGTVGPNQYGSDPA